MSKGFIQSYALPDILFVFSHKLSVLTGIPYEFLKEKPTLNPEAVVWIKTNIDEFLARWIRYPDEIKRVHKLVLEKTGEDIYKNARAVPEFLREDKS